METIKLVQWVNVTRITNSIVFRVINCIGAIINLNMHSRCHTTTMNASQPKYSCGYPSHFGVNDIEIESSCFDKKKRKQNAYKTLSTYLLAMKPYTTYILLYIVFRKLFPATKCSSRYLPTPMTRTYCLSLGVLQFKEFFYYCFFLLFLIYAKKFPRPVLLNRRATNRLDGYIDIKTGRQTYTLLLNKAITCG